MAVSPPSPRKAAMSPQAFARLLDRYGHGQTSAALTIGVDRATVIRWLKGTTPISAANVLLIRDRLKPKK